MSIAIVIPTVNEKENIELLLPKIFEVLQSRCLQGWILIVDDGSQDGTVEVAERLGEATKKVYVIKRPKKMGLGSAYKDGFRLALAQGSEGVVEMDADLSHDPAYLPIFFAKVLEGYDLVVGSRYVMGGSIAEWSAPRRIISRAANMLARLLLGLAIKDCTSGYRAYSARALIAVGLDSVRSDGYAFQVEMVMRCQRAGLRICEVPIKFVNRSRGASKLTLIEMLRFLSSTIKLAMS
jgi:dolichol-phosphate mannosyltransferase